MRNDYNEFNEQNEQNGKNEWIERILRNELVEDELAGFYSMNRTSETNVTNRTNTLMETIVFASTSETNNWF
ncbi:hypothetical protein JCM18549_28150 [Halolamina salina]